MPTCECCRSTGWLPLFESYGYTLGRCTSCNLHYVDPMPSPDTRHADVASGVYGEDQVVIDADGKLAAERALSSRFQHYIDMAQRWIPDGHWLDVGCGSGVLMDLAQEAGYTVEGIELTPDRREITRRTTGAVVHDKPVEDLGLSPGAYDVVSLINVFSHLVEPTRTFAELGRLTRPGGIVVVATGEIVGGEAEKRHLPEWILGDELFFLGEGTFARYAKQSGMEVVDHHRVWLPESIYARERFKVKGRSPLRNAVKTVFTMVPGALPALRFMMKRIQSDNPIFSTTYVLRRPV